MSVCEHVYTYLFLPICPNCGADTHEIDWVKESTAHKEFIESGKAVPQGWWSI